MENLQVLYLAQLTTAENEFCAAGTSERAAHLLLLQTLRQYGGIAPGHGEWFDELRDDIVVRKLVSGQAYVNDLALESVDCPNSDFVIK
mgnify:FL=1